MKSRALLLLVITSLLGVAGEGRAQTPTTNSISIEHPWAHATPAGAKTGAAYLAVINHGPVADHLVGAATPEAAKVQFHQDINDNGVIRMRELPQVDIGPGATFVFKPGGAHIMMVGLKQQLKEGQTLPLTLEFERAGKIELQVPVAKAGSMSGRDMKGM